ncbi:MAG: hypothetical protein QM728_11220 [Gordonia sp. (in: high G+C Gram-positive bacteria)]|uniref:hypothetical protein n=1 Tax=Gordonia sp. (in: high G+C Gram-positive bacteria) TaxID=84139 RepID=UPI0039E476ED
MHPTLAPWADFNVAVAGASAALAGLIIVAMSVNLDDILAAPAIPARAGAAIGALTLTVTAACLPLIPDQSLFLLGVEVLIGGLIAVLLGVVATVAIYRAGDPDPDAGLPPAPPRRQLPVKALLSLTSPVLFTLGGGFLATGNTNGLNWVAAGAITSIIGGVGFAWIALVEIRR